MTRSRTRRRRHVHDKHAVGDGPHYALGRRMFFRAIALRGALPIYGDRTSPGWLHFLTEAARAMGMSPVGQPAVWEYPLAGGAGGAGQTIIQPITESFLALDTWPDHDGAYLFICSCRPFTADCLKPLLERFGLEQGQAFGAPEMLEIV